jgi:hypothetical protein
MDISGAPVKRVDRTMFLSPLHHIREWALPASLRASAAPRESL